MSGAEGIVFKVVDNGPPGTDASTGFLHYPEGALESCIHPGVPQTFGQGNYVIHDAVA